MNSMTHWSRAWAELEPRMALLRAMRTILRDRAKSFRLAQEGERQHPHDAVQSRSVQTAQTGAT